VVITVEPNPVPWTNIAVDGCDSNTPNRWAWAQNLENKGSQAVTFTRRNNYFDGSLANFGTFSLTLSPGEKYTHATRWCSGVNADHTFRTDWIGTTASGSSVTVTGPEVRLLDH